MILNRKIFFTGQRILLLLLYCFFYTTAYAQPSLNTRKIKDDQLFYLLPHAMFLLKAPSDTGNILNTREQEWFKVPGNMAFNIGSLDKDIWMRFSVDNTSDTARNIALVLGSHRLYEVVLFEKDSGILKEKGIAGLKYPFSKRAYPFFVTTFPLHIAAQSTSYYYIKMDRNGISPLCIPMLMDMKELKYQEQRTYLSYGILIGIIFLSGIFNLFLFFVLKEKIHLYYFLYSICAVWVMFSINRIDFQFLFPNQPSFSSISRFSSAFIFTGFLFLVMQTFLGQTKSNSRFFVVSKWLRNICFICPIIEIVRGLALDINWTGFSEVHFILYEWIISISLLMVILSCIEKILQKNQLAWFYLLAISVTVIGGMLSIIAVSGLVDWSFLLMPPSTVEVGLTLEAIIICFGILYRYNFYKKEKDALVFQLQDEKIKAAGEIIATQEQEQKRIAADLHDELGGNLAAIKMTLQSFHLSAEQKETINYLIDKASNNTRHIAHDLMPPEFENTSLLELLDRFYMRLNTKDRINFYYHSTGSGHSFNKQKELMIYRIILELTNNIIKHSEATEATIQFIYYDDHLEIMVEDNGTGIDKNTSGGIGLKTVQSRLDYLRGNMNIDSGAKGTTTIIQIPYNPA
jgi:signal transduction histidine kinase